MGRFKGYKRRNSSNESSVVQQKATQPNIWQNSPFTVQRKTNNSSSLSSVKLQLKKAQESGFDFSKVSLRAPTVQKMTVGQVGDEFEKDADVDGDSFSAEMQNSSVQTQKMGEEEVEMKADSVQKEQMGEEEMEMKSESVQREPEDEMEMKSESVQREPEDEMEMKSESVQREPEDEMEMKSESVQREPEDEMEMKSDSVQRDGGLNLGGGEVSSDLEQEINDVKQNETRDLSTANKETIQNSSTFGNTDPGNIKIADSPKANKVCEKLGATAATTGNVMMFKNPGDYSDNIASASPDKQKLFGHEYKHTLHQGATPVVQSKQDKKKS